MADFRVFEFDLIENKFVIGFNYKGIGKRYISATICLAPSGILILSLNKGVSDSEPIELNSLHLYPDETAARKSYLNKQINSVSDAEVLEDLNNFFKDICNGH